MELEGSKCASQSEAMMHQMRQASPGPASPAARSPELVLVRVGGRRTHFLQTPTLLPRFTLRSLEWSDAPAQITFCGPQAEVAPTLRRIHDSNCSSHCPSL
ncbi:hypothetical protein DPSP01_001934 [Paraphaeosphaeria sporulosa]